MTQSVCVPSGRTVFSLGLVGASSSPAPPLIRGEITGDTPPPATVAATPLFHLRQPLPRLPCAGRRRHHLPRHCDVVHSPVLTFSLPKSRRNGVLAGIQYIPSPGRLLFLASAPVDVVVFPSGIAAARSSSASLPLHPNPSAVHHRRLRSFSSSTSRRSPGSSSRCAATVIVIAAACSTPSSSPCSCCRLPSSPPRRPRSSSSSSSRRSRSSWRSSLRRAILVRRPRSSSEPLQPRRRLRPRLRIVKRCAGRISPSSKDCRRSRPLAVRLRRSRPPPPRPFVVVVPSPRRVVACSFACVLRIASVVPEVPEAWFAVVAEGSEGRSL
ncbi:uncharacterized protein [Oryza sativa Japonica Group]|uniref:uncharacterized protein n=1 Tax=Oryza sativa subsp. japonica TaxID=39947 RepID=UPI00339C8025